MLSHYNKLSNNRNSDTDDLDLYPTPPWATRALCEYILYTGDLKYQEVLEPACGQGHMAEPLGEYFKEVYAYDIEDYGYDKMSGLQDFLECNKEYQWIITNPPFTNNLTEKFIHKANDLSINGFAIFGRTTLMESIGRYNRIWSVNPPTTIGVFTERVPIIRGKLSNKASTTTSYSWFVWNHNEKNSAGNGHIDPNPRLIWIPPCRKELEKDEDYAQI